jgi:transcriptional regulator with XRE-family HTH domain
MSSKLEVLRKKAGLTQTQLASKIGIVCRSYQRYESGNSHLESMKYKQLRKLAIALNTTIENLLEE